MLHSWDSELIPKVYLGQRLQGSLSIQSTCSIPSVKDESRHLFFSLNFQSHTGKVLNLCVKTAPLAEMQLDHLKYEHLNKLTSRNRGSQHSFHYSVSGCWRRVEAFPLSLEARAAPANICPGMATLAYNTRTDMKMRVQDSQFNCSTNSIASNALTEKKKNQKRQNVSPGYLPFCQIDQNLNTVSGKISRCFLS